MKLGQCLLRSADVLLADWMIFEDGTFVPAPPTPYENPQAASRFGYCDSVIDGNITSVKYVPDIGRYIALAAQANGLFMQTSTDLVSWSKRVPVAGIMPDDPGVEERRQRGDSKHKRWYFSLLDPDSPSDNFDRVGLMPYVYYVKFGNDTDRNLRVRRIMRVPVRLEFSPD